MGVYAGPDVSESGLVLSLDAGNTKGFDKFENLTLQTSQIGVTPTYSVAGIVGLNTTATTAPNNLYEASLLDNNGNTNQYVFGGAAVGLTTNTTYTYSIHIKQGTKPDFTITIDENGFGGKRYQSTFTYSNESVTTGVTGAANDGVVVSSTATKLTNGWYRLSLTFRTSTTSVGGFVDMINRFGNTAGSNYLWGRQLEISSTVTDYYATTGTAKTRGSTLIDLSGRGNTGTLTNGPTYSSSNGGSIVFDGTNDQIAFSSSSSLQFLNRLPYTLEAWVYPTTNPGANNWTGIFDRESNAGSGRDGYNLYFLGSAGTDTYFFTERFTSGSYNAVSVTLNQSVSVNNWHHIVGTYDGTTLTLYRNSSSVGTPVTTTGNITNTSKSLTLGVRGGQYYRGNISNVKIYNRALTATEIQQNYIATKSRYGL